MSTLQPDNTDPTIVLTKDWQIKLFHMRAQLSAMRLEQVGLRHSSGRSVTAHVKRTYGFKGNREKVIDQLHNLIIETEKEHGVTGR